MTKPLIPKPPPADGPRGVADQAAEALQATTRLPLRIAGRLLMRTIQALFALFILILHPQVKWLAGLIARSAFVQKVVKPGLKGFATAVYDPYFDYLSHLPPFWATVSIAVPLALLEPAKFLATIMIAEYPKIGILLWLGLQGLSLILIDRTWRAVRPQSRKIWLVSRVHAWGWLNAEYGKHWIKQSAAYRSAVIWKLYAARATRSLWRKMFARHGQGLP